MHCIIIVLMKLNFNATYIEILPTDESYRYRSIMGEHTLTLYFSLSTYTEIPTGAWCEFANERYTLNQPAKIVKHSTRNFEYTLTMDSEGANLKNYKFRNPNDKTLKFPFTASPRYHVQILVDCLNMIDSGWQVGNCIESSKKLVSYNHNNCLEALEMIAKAFETEYEIIGKTIHLHKVEYFKNNPLPLQYGKGKGFKTGVSRTTEQSRITRLYVQGGDRNIDRSKYGNKELLLPKSQEYTYEGVTFVSDDKGLSITIKNAQNNGFVNEQSLDLSHIYPKRKGTVSGFFAVDIDKHFYDIFDDSIPQALDFNAMQIKGEKMLIYFESGMLSGREFEVSKYDHAQKRFQLVPKEEDGVTMPNDIFRPNIGDEYSVYNMQMPNAYISDNATKSGASWEMMKEACKYLYENSTDLFTFTGDLDGIWAKKKWANVGGRLKMGAYINFSDTEFQRTPVAIRIVGLKEYVNNPYSPQIELSNKVQGHSFASEIRKLQNQEVYFGELNKRTISETKRRWRDAQETIKQIEKAFPEYTKSIVPATVQTMMALIGNKSTQFDFVISKANPIKAPHTLYFDKNSKQINAGSGWLKHFTLGSSDITPNRDANSYKYWNIPAFVSGRLDDKAKTYYLYIKASKTDETAEFVLSENKIDIEKEAGFYHFLYATVNSEYEGERGVSKLNGFTEITGGQIKTDKITSGNGEQYIHLFDDHIEIKANLKITDGNKTDIKQLVNPDLQQNLQEAKNFGQQKVNELQVGGRNYILKSNDFITSEYKFLNISPSFRNEVVKSDNITLSVDIMFNNLIGGNRLGIEFHIIYTDDTFQYFNVWRWINTGDIGTSFSERIVNVIQNEHKGKKIKEISPLGLHIQCSAESIKISNPKLEIGNKPTDWSPAPEDVWDTMVDLGIIDKNAMNLTEVEKANVKFINGMFSKGADYTNGTDIVKNTITTGALTVGNTLGGNAGINGAGLDGKSIRFFAGANYRDKESAPFRVQDDGSIYASKGQIGRFKIESAENTSLIANGLQIKSQGIINAYGKGIDRNTSVIINDPSQLNEPVGNRPVINVFSSGFNNLSHSSMEIISRGGRYNKALILDASITSSSSYNAIALDVVSGYIKTSEKTAFIMKGKAMFEETYIGASYSDIITSSIGFCHTYVFNSVSSDNVFLSNRWEIESLIGKSNITFELQIMATFNISRNIIIRGRTGGRLLDNSGNPYSGADGVLSLGRGNTLILRYVDGHYYIMSHRE